MQAIDPAFAATIPVNDLYRITRALEIHAVTGLPPSSFASERLAPWGSPLPTQPPPTTTRAYSTRAPHMFPPQRVVAHAHARAETSLDFRCVYFTTSDSLAAKTRIDLRCEEMVRRGLLQAATPPHSPPPPTSPPTHTTSIRTQETMALLYSGLEVDSTPAKAIGYSEAISFLLYAPVRAATARVRTCGATFPPLCAYNFLAGQHTQLEHLGDSFTDFLTIFQNSSR